MSKRTASAAARKDARFLKEIGETIATRPRTLQLKDTNKILKGLVRERGNHGDKLMKAGAVLLLSPDPITDVAAVPVLIAGRMLRSRQSITLKDVYEELRKTTSSIASISSSL